MIGNEASPKNAPYSAEMPEPPSNGRIPFNIAGRGERAVASNLAEGVVGI